jgi:hypothetical protein
VLGGMVIDDVSDELFEVFGRDGHVHSAADAGARWCQTWVTRSGGSADSPRFMLYVAPRPPTGISPGTHPYWILHVYVTEWKQAN